MNKKTKKDNRKLKVKEKLTVTNYPVGDFLIRIKNAALAKRHLVFARKNSKILAVARVLEKEGYLENINPEGDKINVNITFRKKEPVLLGLKLVTKPGLRIYMKADDLRKKRGVSIYLVSTPKGVISSKEAIKNNLGGEVIAEVW